jgi:hypothetical protein
VEQCKPSIYSLIETLKEIELQVSTQIYNRVEKNGPKLRERKWVDIERDIKITTLEQKLINDQIDLYGFMRCISFLYSYEVNKDKTEDNDKEPVDIKIPPQIINDSPKYTDLSGMKYPEIKTFFAKHYSKMCDLVNNVRSTNPAIFINQSIDFNCSFLYNYAPDHNAITTTGDGNCLFNATAISMFGDETNLF